MKSTILALSAALAAASPAFAQPQNEQGLQNLTYADLADLGAGAPVVAHLRVRGSDRLGEREAATVPQGFTRFEIEAEVVALIRGAGGVPARVRYLVDLPNDSRGRPARITRRSEYLVFATRVPTRPDELRLVTADAQLAYSGAAAELLRGIVREASAAEAPPRITGIGRAFSVPGSLPGESETQIFLLTADQRPISLTVLRRPGEQVALVGRAGRDRRRRRRAAAGRTRCSGTGSPAPCPPGCPQMRSARRRRRNGRRSRRITGVIRQGLGPCARTRVPRR